MERKSTETSSPFAFNELTIRGNAIIDAKGGMTTVGLKREGRENAQRGKD